LQKLPYLLTCHRRGFAGFRLAGRLHARQSRRPAACDQATREHKPIDDAITFEAVITPRRSLSLRAMRVLLAAICVLCIASASLFVRLGAWPVGGFTGLELLLAAWLFRLHLRDGRSSELVLLSPSGLRIIRTTAIGRRREIRLEPSWLRVRLIERPGRTPALVVQAGTRHTEIGAALGDAEKRDLAQALDAALYRWRNPRFDNPVLEPAPTKPD